ncbi:hypothetical protein CerSpe_132290 [Prunus speciosa]
MASLSLVAAAALAVASVSADISDKLPSHRSTDVCSTSDLSHSSVHNTFQDSKSSWVSHISVSKLANFSLSP